VGEEIGLDQGHPPTNTYVVALRYSDSRQMAPPALYPYSAFFPENRHTTGNKGACSNLAVPACSYIFLIFSPIWSKSVQEESKNYSRTQSQAEYFFRTCTTNLITRRVAAFGRHGMPPPASNNTATAFCFPNDEEAYRQCGLVSCDLDLWSWNWCAMWHVS